MSVIRSAVPADRDAVAALLAAAFLDDPVMRWMQPAPTRRAPMLRRLFAAQLRHEYLPAGGVRVVEDATGRLVAAALWRPAAAAHHGPVRDRLAPAVAVVAAAGAVRTRLPAALGVLGALNGAHPTTPHAYLNKVGTIPECRRRGYAGALLDVGLAGCDAAGTPAYLEATRPSLRRFYEAREFRCTGTIIVPGGGPEVFAMWRDSR